MVCQGLADCRGHGQSLKTSRAPGEEPVKTDYARRSGWATLVKCRRPITGRVVKTTEVGSAASEWKMDPGRLISCRLLSVRLPLFLRTVSFRREMVCCRSALRKLSILMVCAAAFDCPVAQMSPPMPGTTPQDTQTDEAGPGSSAAAESDSGAHEQLTGFPHSESSRYWISGQANVVFQWHPSFPAQYSGRNSLTPGAQSATTHILTLYTGYALTHTTEVFADVEDATGGGIGSAFGLAGYTNLDAVRTAQGIPLSKGPYLARLMLRQIVPLGDEHIEVDRDELHLATSVPARRLEIRFGKFSLADFFDVNTWGRDSHLQFLNWTVDNDGAWDYAAKTRGYTDGALVEYDDHWFSARFGEALEPKVANGIYLDADIARARAANLELEAQGSLVAHRRGAVRLLSYLNQANMGHYREAITELPRWPDPGS